MLEIASDVQMDTVQLDTSYSQRLNSGKSPGTCRCEWLWAFARCPNEPLPKLLQNLERRKD